MNGGKTYEDFNKKPPDNQAIYDMVKATVEWFGEDNRMNVNVGSRCLELSAQEE